MKKEIQRSVKKRRIRGIEKVLYDSRAVLELTHRTDRLPFYTAVSVFLFVAGFFLPAMIGNIYLMPVLAVGMALSPWLYILFNALSFQKQLTTELETALSMVTMGYLRTDNFIEAVRESVNNMNYPVREIFERFLVQATMVSADIPKSLREMKSQLDNAVFHEWIDQVISCLSERALKTTLQPIVSTLSSVREESDKHNNRMYEKNKEFIQMSALIVLNYPMTALMNPTWFHFLTDYTVGQILVAFSFAVIFISLVACINKNRPAEYKG
ncbi:hypothetical protein A7X67_01525 [Clostridium sp. W14A]|nr:hypothetical protein A7X67_01525 [Clostridium sp. W14A]